MTLLLPEQELSFSLCFAFLLHKGFLQSQLAADFQLSLHCQRRAFQRHLYRAKTNLWQAGCRRTGSQHKRDVAITLEIVLA